MKKTIRSHSEVWCLHVQTGLRDTDAAIEEAQNLFTAENQAPISEGSSDEAAAGEVLLLRPSLSPPGAVSWRLGTRGGEARDQGGRRENPPTWGAR